MYEVGVKTDGFGGDRMVPGREAVRATRGRKYRPATTEEKNLSRGRKDEVGIGMGRVG
jgi:hypothetical protein